ncbi:MAG: dehypoxanthine futalosine cyclase [Planctomycetes bacterium]|nr:dehypoxanthine futalosine cyclase [Planctomycetota bacterium]
MDVSTLSAKVLDGARLSQEEGLFLHENAGLDTLAFLADEVRRRKHPEAVVTYIIDRNLNPTNICVTDCTFCAFYAKPKDEVKGYVLDREEIYKRVQETVDVGGVQILMQSGHHPQLGVEWFSELFRDLKERWPDLHLHAMSPPEIHHLSKVSKCSTEEVLKRLQAAGMNSMPGGGAEILTESVRKQIATRKADTDTWLRIMEEAHGIGMKTTATMMFGHIETVADRIEHLERLRQVQDRTGGFTAFIDWTFQPGGNPLGDQLHAEGWKKATHAEYFRTTALARIYLDNFDNIQASFVTQGASAAQLALRMGCNDFGSAMLEENVVSAAGCFELVEIKNIERNIREAGFAPRQRNQGYDIIDPRGATPQPGELESCGAAATGKHQLV